MNLKNQVENSWKQPNFLTLALLPLSMVYWLLSSLRSFLFRCGWRKRFSAHVPVVIVGNITVGGTGKTPLTIYLIELLRNNGFTPGVISRGYGSNADYYPYPVKDDSPVEHSGDEPALIVKRTKVPMVIGADRKKSIEVLSKDFPQVDVILSDDGLQHLALDRDIEVCVVSGSKTSSNEFLFPAGPYRESKKRLETVDLIVSNGSKEDSSSEFSMTLVAGDPEYVNPALKESNGKFDSSDALVAIAGIGNPERFFQTCHELGFDIQEVAYADHHKFQQSDIEFGDKQVLMTEKDAVKCVNFAGPNHWYLPVDAKLSQKFNERFLQLVQQAVVEKHTH